MTFAGNQTHGMLFVRLMCETSVVQDQKELYCQVYTRQELTSANIHDSADMQRNNTVEMKYNTNIM